MKTEFTYTASDGETISVTGYGENRGENARCIIYAHGFKGFKDWGFVPYIGEFLSDRGFLVLTFNFSHNGIGDNPTEFTELDKFSRNTLSREVRELSEITDAAIGGFCGPVKNPRVGLLGHSRGGGIALLTTPLRRQIAATTVWSSVSTFDRYSEAQKKKWREDGYLEIVNQRTGQVMYLSVGLLEDFEMYQDDHLNIERAVRDFHCPLLIVHGEQDESVPVDDSRKIYQWIGQDKGKLLIVPETGHTFGAIHPFGGSNEKLDLVLGKTAEFFSANL